jgi:hypothetical protein
MSWGAIFLGDIEQRRSRQNKYSIDLQLELSYHYKLLRDLE